MSYNAFVRGLRVRHCLSQGELAELLDINQARISRFESGDETPTLSITFGYQVIFGVPPCRLFPKLYSQVEEAVMRRAAKLERRVARRTDFQSRKKRHLLEAMAKRSANQDGE